MSLIANLFRSGLERMGYALIKPEFSRFGLSLYVDVRRIGRQWGWSTTTVFDVGANVGQFAAEALAGFPEATVWSFEPFPKSFAKLVDGGANARLKPFQLALSDRIGESAFFAYSEEGDGSHINSLTDKARFPQRFGYKPRELTVKTSTIDAFCSEHGVERIDLLKVDTEGFDLVVLTGAEAMLRAGRVRFIYVEFNDLFEIPGAEGGALIPIAEYLKRFGYAYLTTYTDFVIYKGEVSVNANALFVLPPESARAPAAYD